MSIADDALADLSGLSQDDYTPEELDNVADRMVAELVRRTVPARYRNAEVEEAQHDYVQKMVTEAKEKRSPILVFHGETGTGKTHFLHAMRKRNMRHQIRQKLEKSPGKQYVTRLYTATVRQEPYDSVYPIVPKYKIHKWLNLFDGRGRVSDDDLAAMIQWDGALCLDDIGAAHGGWDEQRALYRVIDERLEEMRWTIVTTNLTAEDMATKWEDACASRIWSGASVRTTGEDRRR